MAPTIVAASSLPSSTTGTSVASDTLEVALELIDSVSLELLFFVVAIAIALSFRRLRKITAVGPSHGFAKFPKRVPQQRKIAPAPEVRSCPTNGCATETIAKNPMTLEEFVQRTINARLQTTSAISYYTELKLTGRHLQIGECLTKSGSTHSAIDFFGAMVQCAGRAGRPQLVVDLLDDAAKAGCKCPLSVYESAMKLLAGKKCFKEALDVYDRLEANGLEPSPVTFSCLVGFAAELGESDRAIIFFNKLSARDVPSIRAYMTVLRVYSQRKDWDASMALVTKMQKCGAEVDSLALNIVLSTGVAAMKVGAAARMLGEEPWTSIADVVSYNIILKGLAQQGETAKAVELLGSMRERKVAGNHISYNTAIDAAVRGHQVEDAWAIYSSMQDAAGLTPDKCTASTMVKALQLDPRRDRVEIIASMLQATLHSCSVDLASRLLASTLQVAVKLKDLKQAMRVFELMRRVKADSCHAASFAELALLAARMEDAASCTTLWKQALPDVAELRAAKASVTQELAKGGDVCRVTLRVLNHFLNHLCAGKRDKNNFAGTPKARSTVGAPGVASWRKHGE